MKFKRTVWEQANRSEWNASDRRHNARNCARSSRFRNQLLGMINPGFGGATVVVRIAPGDHGISTMADWAVRLCVSVSRTTRRTR